MMTSKTNDSFWLLILLPLVLLGASETQSDTIPSLLLALFILLPAAKLAGLAAEGYMASWPLEKARDLCSICLRPGVRSLGGVGISGRFTTTGDGKGNIENAYG
jgi:hypothetical protein